MGHLLYVWLMLILSHTVPQTLLWVNWIESPLRDCLSLYHNSYTSLCHVPSAANQPLIVPVWLYLLFHSISELHKMVMILYTVTFMIHFSGVYHYLYIYVYNHCIHNSCLQCLDLSLLLLSSHKCTANLYHRHQWSPQEKKYIYDAFTSFLHVYHFHFYMQYVYTVHAVHIYSTSITSISLLKQQMKPKQMDFTAYNNKSQHHVFFYAHVNSRHRDCNYQSYACITWYLTLLYMYVLVRNLGVILSRGQRTSRGNRNFCCVHYVRSARGLS